MTRHPTRAIAAADRAVVPGRSEAHPRLRYLDNLKVLLIAAIIAGHAVAGYSALEWWPYSEMKEVELSPVTQAVLFMAGGPFVLVLVPMLFLVAGLLTPDALERKGPGRFARDRLVRLALPFTVYVLVLQPALMYPVHPPGPTGSYWSELVGGQEHTLDTGPLWFVGALLVFSLAMAAWTAMPWSSRGPRSPRNITMARLGVVVAVVAIATFLMRLAVPFGESNPGVTLNVFEWPACIALFYTGVVGASRDWATAIPLSLRRRCRAATAATFVSFGAVLGLLVLVGVPSEDWWGGPHLASLAWATCEAGMAVFGSVWLLGVAQSRLEGHVRWCTPPVARSAYGAFLLQVLFLIGLAFALRPVGLPAEAKAVLLASGSVTGSFALAWLLIRHVPGVSRVL
jgi:hypothetical protein